MLQFGRQMLLEKWRLEGKHHTHHLFRVIDANGAPDGAAANGTIFATLSARRANSKVSARYEHYVKRFIVANAAEYISWVNCSSTLCLGLRLRLRHTGLQTRWQPDRTGAALRHECPLELHYRLASWRLESGATGLGMLWLGCNLSWRCKRFCPILSAGARQIRLLRSQSHSRAGHHLHRWRVPIRVAQLARLAVGERDELVRRRTGRLLLRKSWDGHRQVALWLSAWGRRKRLDCLLALELELLPVTTAGHILERVRELPSLHLRQVFPYQLHHCLHTRRIITLNPTIYMNWTWVTKICTKQYCMLKWCPIKSLRSRIRNFRAKCVYVCKILGLKSIWGWRTASWTVLLCNIREVRKKNVELAEIEKGYC